MFFPGGLPGALWRISFRRAVSRRAAPCLQFAAPSATLGYDIYSVVLKGRVVMAQVPKIPENFRDLGGIIGAEGRPIAPRRLLRSGEVVGLSSADAELLSGAYGLRCIIDLRGTAERAQKPDDTLPGVSYHSIDLMQDIAPNAPGAKQMSELVSTPGAMDEFMFLAYALLVEDDDARAGLRRAVEILAEVREGSGLFHCFAGKDRAGVTAAVVLTILGVSREDIFRDYLRTNELRAQSNRALLEEARREGAGPERLAAIETAIGVKPAFLAHAYELAEKHFGSFENYVAEGIGVDANLKGEFRARFLQ